MSAPSFWSRLAHLKAVGHPAMWPSTVSWPHVSPICLQPAGGVRRVDSEERSILARRLSLLPCELKSWNSLSGFHIHRWEQGRLNVSLLLPHTVLRISSPLSSLWPHLPSLCFPLGLVSSWQQTPVKPPALFHLWKYGVSSEGIKALWFWSWRGNHYCSHLGRPTV